MWRRREVREAVELQPGERVLADAEGPDGVTVATTYGLVLSGGGRIAWHEIDTATWDGEGQLLDVVGAVDEAGRRRRLRLRFDRPRRLVDVVREQVTASVVISRHVPIDGPRGVRVTGRRTGSGELVWSVVADAGLLVPDETTQARVDAAVARVRSEVE